MLDALRRTDLLHRDDRILVAVSGGPDSTALLVGLVECGYTVVAAHYDHAFRTGSDLDANWVTERCANVGVRCVTGRRTEPLAKGSRQAAARDLRYAFLERARSVAGCDVIAVAHTADDVVEGVLLHMLRGTGIAGLRGIPRRNGCVVRPLTSVRHNQVEDYLQRRGIEPLRDPSNEDEEYARVRARRVLLPALERARPDVAGRLLAIAGRAEFWQSEIERQSAPLVETPSAESLGTAPDPVAAEAVRTLYARAGGTLPALSRRHIESILRLTRNGRPAELHLPDGFVFRVAYGNVSIDGRTDERSETRSVRLLTRECRDASAHSRQTRRADPTVAHVKRGSISLSTRRPGMRMRPLPHGRTRRLQDILVDAKVPRERRDDAPLVLRDGRLAWVPGIALDRDAAAAPGERCVEVSLEIDGCSQESR